MPPPTGGSKLFCLHEALPAGETYEDLPVGRCSDEVRGGGRGGAQKTQLVETYRLLCLKTKIYRHDVTFLGSPFFWEHEALSSGRAYQVLPAGRCSDKVSGDRL